MVYISYLYRSMHVIPHCLTKILPCSPLPLLPGVPLKLPANAKAGDIQLLTGSLRINVADVSSSLGDKLTDNQWSAYKGMPDDNFPEFLPGCEGGGGRWEGGGPGGGEGAGGKGVRVCVFGGERRGSGTQGRGGGNGAAGGAEGPQIGGGGGCQGESERRRRKTPPALVGRGGSWKGTRAGVKERGGVGRGGEKGGGALREIVDGEEEEQGRD